MAAAGNDRIRGPEDLCRPTPQFLSISFLHHFKIAYKLQIHSSWEGGYWGSMTPLSSSLTNGEVDVHDDIRSPLVVQTNQRNSYSSW